MHISGNVFAVVYRNSTTQGIVKTFTISPDGSFKPKPEMNMSIFAEDLCFDPCFVYDVNDTYAVVYATSKSGLSEGGYIITLKLGKNGSITSLINSRKRFELKQCFNPIILPLSEHIFAITYTGKGGSGVQGHPGYLITIAYADKKGIFKGDSFMLTSSTKQVEGRINNVKIYYNNTNLGINWHHVALTFDGISMCLYIDGGKKLLDGRIVPNVEKPYPYSAPNNEITLTKDDLYLGRNYLGYIDEIAIYEKALNGCQINCIFQNTTSGGILEYYLLGEQCCP
jgi:hypothetical protein